MNTLDSNGQFFHKSIVTDLSFFKQEVEEVGGGGCEGKGSAGGPVKRVGKTDSKKGDKEAKDHGEDHHPGEAVGVGIGNRSRKGEEGNDKNGADHLDHQDDGDSNEREEEEVEEFHILSLERCLLFIKANCKEAAVEKGSYGKDKNI